MNKKAQIQLGESIFVVIIIVLLIVFGLVFYAQAQKESIDAESSGFDDLDTIAIAQYATSLVELQCSLQEVQYPNCFDITKLEAFHRVVQGNTELEKEFYFSQLGNAKLNITEIYPVTIAQPQRSWQLYDNQPTTLAEQAQATLPVSLYNPIEDTYSFGVLTIIQYR
ncbi:MAG: hypothetical protein KC535_00510 [Nanoarchaeota archaeon]|nr:hypothetical protein [Nanoarchaeota archaeon]